MPPFTTNLGKTLHVLATGGLHKALIINTATADRIPVQFNPEEYTLSRENNFAQAAVPGLGGPILQFAHGNLKTLEMELFVDTYEAHNEGALRTRAGDDVRLITNRLVGLMEINADLHAPPVLLFTWGGLSFSCVLARVTQRFILFRPDGVPIRARMQVTFHEYLNASLERKEVKTQTADYSKLYVVSQGETLSSIAAAVYDDPTMWRPIALLNRLDDPRSLSTGQQLLIPRLPFRDPETGEVLA
jgi:nucleoid-associated protein YgaU